MGWPLPGRPQRSPLKLSRTLLPLATAALVSAPLQAHEDDPKLLDRRPPVFSQGYRRAMPQGGLLSTTTVSNLGTNFNSSGVSLLSWVPLNLIDGASSGTATAGLRVPDWP
ncbi:MAG: hypothetical protein R3E96_03375 [Planctomycetota bacterium]